LAMYMLIGRTPDYAWSLTSASHDVRDVFAETLCEPDGSEPTADSNSYEFDGECQPFEVFDAGMVWNAKRLLKDGFLKAPIHWQCCMHVHGGMEGNARNLVHLVDSLPEGSTWSAFGCGPTADLIMAMAITMGGHVRVGMEDNVYLSKGVLAKHNSEFVQKVQRLAVEFNRPVATAAEARQILGLPPKK